MHFTVFEALGRCDAGEKSNRLNRLCHQTYKAHQTFRAIGKLLTIYKDVLTPDAFYHLFRSAVNAGMYKRLRILKGLDD